jgi:hypothetical protein
MIFFTAFIVAVCGYSASTTDSPTNRALSIVAVALNSFILGVLITDV